MKNFTQHNPSNQVLRATAILALMAFAAIATAGPVKSVGQMTFADANTVVIADWRGGEIHALQLPPAASVPAKPFNLKNISTPSSASLMPCCRKLPPP